MSYDWKRTVLKDDGRYQLVKYSLDDRLAVAEARIAALRGALRWHSVLDDLDSTPATREHALNALLADDEAAKP